MKMYIPQIGDVIKLNEDWEFNLHYESRNIDLLHEFFNFEKKKYIPYTEASKFNNFKLLKDTILTIDRIYIRKGADDFSSITFNAILPSGFKGRFWAKLEDVNNIEFDILKIKDINQKFTTFMKELSSFNIDELFINKSQFKNIDMHYPNHYNDYDKYVLTEFNCQFENDKDKINLIVKKHEYKDNKTTYYYILEYNSLNEINKRKEKKSYNDSLFINHKELNYNPTKNIHLTNKIVEIYEDELYKSNQLSNDFSR